MLELAIIEAVLVICLMNLALLYPCSRKKKPEEDQKAKPKFTTPATVSYFSCVILSKVIFQANRLSTGQSKPNGNARDVKPTVEHTISIKLDNNADEDDLQGPRESMSRDHTTDGPAIGIFIYIFTSTNISFSF